MIVNAPMKWSVDSTIHVVLHGRECDPCKGYRRHAFNALCDEDKGFASAVNANKKCWAKEADVCLKMERDQYTALYDDFCGLRKKAAANYEDLQSCRSELHKCKDDLEDADDEVASLKKKVADLETKIASVGEEERARYQALASKGKHREAPLEGIEPMAKRIWTMSIEGSDDEPMPFEEQFPALPCCQLCQPLSTTCCD
jgi:hypothetical protein